MILFAVFLLSRSCGILKIPYVWCQKRDLNSRPPAYESEVTNNGGILSKKTYTLLKYGKQELFFKKRIKNIMKYRTCFLTSLSLLKGLNSEYICCVFAESKLTSLINKSIYMSIYFTHNITNSILFKIVNRCSYKLIKKRKNMKNKKLKFNLAIPKTPREFYCEVSNLLLTIEAIKKVAKDFNCNYKLDYLNAKVSFINKN